MLHDFIESAIIVDDNESEVTNLKSVLDSKKILYEYYHPNKIYRRRFKFKNRKLIFLDLYLGSGNLATQISTTIDKIFKKAIGNDFGTYGIVLWSRHTDDVEEGNTERDLDIFREKLSIAVKLGGFTPPLFIVGLDKRNYNGVSGFNGIFIDLERALEENTAASFFIKWSNAVEKGKTNTIKDIFSLVQDYKLQNDNLKFLLYHLAKNKTGIHHDELDNYPLHRDAYQAFSELLLYDISSQMAVKECALFGEYELLQYRKDSLSKDFKNQYFNDSTLVDIEAKIKEEEKIKQCIRILKNEGALPATDPKIIALEAQKNTINNERTVFKDLDKEIRSHFSLLNAKMLLDENIKSLKNILPGNIYQVKHQKSLFLSDKQNSTDIPIVIEMTPPCDFANGKKAKEKVKVLAGFITKYSESRIQSLRGDAIYTEPHPLKLEKFDDEKMLVFDFRYVGILDEKDLLNKKKYELIYRAKDNLFADILQKMSAHIARLGLAVLH